MRFILRQAWREMRNSRSFCLFYAVNLALGLVGFVVVDSFRESIETKVASESRELLGADLAIRARRPITYEELDHARGTLPGETREAGTVDFFSMAAGPTGRSRLVKVVAMDRGFPFHGEFKLQQGGTLGGDEIDQLHLQPLAWIYPEARAQLEIDLGDELKLGNSGFRIADLIIEEAGLSFQPTDLAPKVFISKKFLDSTGLLGEGNIAFHTHLFRLPDGVDPEIFGPALDRVIDSPEVRVYTHRQAGHRAGRLLRYLTDFLSLVSLVALFLACLGSGFLFHGFLAHRMPELATLVSLGATRSTALSIFSLQLGLLGIFAALPACLACSIFLPALSSAVADMGTTGVQVFVSLRSILLTFGVAVASGWLIALPALQKIKCLQPAELFREAARPGKRTSGMNLLWALPGLLAFWGLCLTQAHSDKLANLFFLCFLGSLVLLYLLSRFGFGLVERMFGRARLPLRLAARSLARNRAGAVTGFLALGLGVLLLTLIPQTHHGLGKEIGLDDPLSDLPSLFLFDLQEEQLDQVQSFLAERNAPLSNLTPWVRGKIKTIKGMPYEKSKRKEEELNNPDEQRRSAFRNRSFNLSYREHLLASEQLLEGRPFSGVYDPGAGRPAEVSIEQKYAQALGLDVGDRMGIEVAGIPIEAEVVNLRRVRWTSFQPNFFVQMQPGVLEEAPKTFLGTLHHLEKEQKSRLQDLLVREFPTVSILDVERTGRKILEVVGQMTWALQVMAALSILAGLVILFCVVREKARSQRWEMNLQKVLGSTTGQLRRQIWIEFGLLGAGASMIGTCLSLVTSYLLSVEVFDRVWSFRWDLPLLVVGCVAGLSVITADFAARRALREKPVRLLQEG
jgi:putative ABC transport system permease protein